MTMATTADHLADAAHEAGEMTEAALHRKAGQMQKFFDDIEELLRRVSSLEDKEISRIRARVESSIDSVKTTVASTAQSAITSTRKAALATDEYVHRKPWVVIGATALTGILLGALLRGSNRD
jgi:ElaB/YqjD/DUF883 family membrane-anchored ribosome-binding protein